MAEAPTNIILEHLRAIRAETENMALDIAELKQRMGLLERRVAHLFGQYAILFNRTGRIDARLERIGRRLDLVDS